MSEHFDKDPSVLGFCVDMVQEVVSKIGYKISIQGFPYVQYMAYTLIGEGPFTPPEILNFVDQKAEEWCEAHIDNI